MAYDKNGYEDDPVYDWGAGCDDVCIYGDAPDNEPDWFDTGDWPPEEDLDIPDWLNDYWNDYFGYPLNGGGSGSGNNSTGSIVPAGRNSLSDAAKSILIQKLTDMLEEYCAYQAMLDYTSADAAEFYDIMISSDVVVGGYNPCTDILIFNNIDMINEAFPEEFIHFFQDSYYQNNYRSGGICGLRGTPQGNNIEFEAKLMQDILNYFGMEQGYNMGLIYYGAGQNLFSTYWAWISYLTNNGTSMPTSAQIFQSFQGYTYWDFMNDWALKFGLQADSNFGFNIFNIFNECQ
jgi:hypothetical protein